MSAKVGLADPTQEIHGKSLAAWSEAYWSWIMNGGSADNADQGDVYFLPLPNATDADPNDPNNILTGHLDATVPAGKPIVLPLVAWMTESYTPESGKPEDPPLSDACFDPTLDRRDCVLGDVKGEAVYTWVTLDGTQVVVNQDKFYTGYTKWAAPVMYPTPTDYGANAATGSQAVIMVIEPLPAGEHTITNYVDFGPIGLFYDNSWALTAVDSGSSIAAGPYADETRPAVEDGIADPASDVAGKSLSTWFGDYWRWMITGADQAAADASDVYFMGLPNGTDIDPSDTATWSQGHLDVTIPAGKPFILPVVAWVTESYTAASGTPDDSPSAEACFDPAIDPRGCSFGDMLFNANHVYLTLDGKQILADQSKFYIDYQQFSPAIDYPQPTDYNSDAATGVQGVGFIVNPLPAGEHQLTLFVDFGQLGHFVYDNSWTITVQ